MNSIQTHAIDLILSIVCIWLVWRPPWPGLPGGRLLKMMKIAVIWIFLFFITDFIFKLFDVEFKDGVWKLVWRSISVVSLVIMVFEIMVFFLAAKRYKKLKMNPELPPLTELSQQEAIPPLFMWRNLTFHNKLKKDILVMASRKADHDQPDLKVLTALQKGETKLIEDAILAGQRFYIIRAKEAMASESDRSLFIREFTEDELRKSDWMVVIESWL